MGVIVVLLTLSLLVALSFLIAFLWSLKSGQYDDTYTPSVRILFSDRPQESCKPKEEAEKDPNLDPVQRDILRPRK